MANYLDFERLVTSVETIAHHADYPGKRDAVNQCREDVEDLSQSGRITPSQGQILLDLLRDARPRLVLQR